MPVPRFANLNHVRFTGVPPPQATASLDRPPAFDQPGTSVAASRRSPSEAPTGFARLVLVRAGLDPDKYRAEPLARRMPACLRALKTDSEAVAARTIDANPDLLERALGVLLIGVTEFFRDDGVFSALMQAVVPELARKAGAIRVWSAGCSSGAELYSIAMLLDEAGGLDRAELLGTDCRMKALANGRRARYSDAEVANLPPRLLQRYFSRQRDGWQLVESVRHRPRWRAGDLLSRVEPGPWDLVLCRNVTIYLESEASYRLLHRIAGQLAPGAFLVTGKAERLPPSIAGRSVARCVYQVPA